MKQNTNTNSEPLLTVEDVRRRLVYQHPGSIRRLFQCGALTGIKLNARTLRFRPSDVDAFILAGLAHGKAAWNQAATMQSGAATSVNRGAREGRAAQ